MAQWWFSSGELSLCLRAIEWDVVIKKLLLYAGWSQSCIIAEKIIAKISNFDKLLQYNKVL